MFGSTRNYVHTSSLRSASWFFKNSSFASEDSSSRLHMTMNSIVIIFLIVIILSYWCSKTKATSVRYSDVCVDISAVARVVNLSRLVVVIMAPKEKPSKKNQQKAQARVIEDRTFGLKNKNKSSKVQSYIKQVEVGIKNSNGAIDAVSGSQDE